MYNPNQILLHLNYEIKNITHIFIKRPFSIIINGANKWKFHFGVFGGTTRTVFLIRTLVFLHVTFCNSIIVWIYQCIWIWTLIVVTLFRYFKCRFIFGNCIIHKKIVSVSSINYGYKYDNRFEYLPLDRSLIIIIIKLIAYFFEGNLE